MNRRSFLRALVVAPFVPAAVKPLNVWIVPRRLYGRVNLSGQMLIAGRRSGKTAFMNAMLLEHQRFYNELQSRVLETLS